MGYRGAFVGHKKFLYTGTRNTEFIWPGVAEAGFAENRTPLSS